MLDSTAKSALCRQLTDLFDHDEYQQIVDILERQPSLDLELALSLVRAYLNLHNVTQDDFCLRRAEDVLNTFEDEGGNDAQYLYLKALTLIKENLLQDAEIRLQRALRFVPLTQPTLLTRIERQLNLIRKAAAVRPLNAVEKAAFDAHAAAHFGTVHAVLKGDKVDLIVFAPQEGHDYYLVVTKGLSALRQTVPSGADPKENACLELALALPKAWPVDRNELQYYYPFKWLLDLTAQIRLSPQFVGFGYTMDNGGPLVPFVRFSALMLTALGDYPRTAQSYLLPDGYRVNIFQVLPLYPLEAAFRQEHSAQDLIERLYHGKAVLCPYYEDRKDVLAPFKVQTASTQTQK